MREGGRRGRSKSSGSSSGGKKEKEQKDRSRSRSKRRKDKLVLSVSNLTRNVNEEHLQEIFGLYGKVKETTLAVDKNVGLPKGYAHIEMSSEHDAEKAVAGLHNGQIDGNIIKVELQGDKKKRVTDENKRPPAQTAVRKPPARPDRDRERERERERDRDRRDRERERSRRRDT